MFPVRLDDQTELKLLEPKHAPAYFQLIDRNRAHIATYVRTPASVKTERDARTLIEDMVHDAAAGRRVSAGIWHQGELVGEIALVGINRRESSCLIGYYLAADAQGKGLATQACRAMISHAFKQLELHRIELHAAVGNVRSRAVAERLGFTQEGVLREAQRFSDRFESLAVYSLLAHEWSAPSLLEANGQE